MIKLAASAACRAAHSRDVWRELAAGQQVADSSWALLSRALWSSGRMHQKLRDACERSIMQKEFSQLEMYNDAWARMAISLSTIHRVT